LTTDVALDYETLPNSYTVTVSVTDNKNDDDSDDTRPVAERVDDTIDVTITVTNVVETGETNSEPEFAGATATRSIPEDTAVGGEVGAAVTATDADNNPLTYSLGGTDVASFEIDSGSGQLTTAIALDYETLPNSYTVTVSVTDNKNDDDSDDTRPVAERVDDTIDVTITVTNVVETGETNSEPEFAGATATRSIPDHQRS
jgi:hypothetical protein